MIHGESMPERADYAPVQERGLATQVGAACDKWLQEHGLKMEGFREMNMMQSRAAMRRKKVRNE